MVEKKRIFCKNIRNYFREYCNCTTIHGFRYFGEKRTIFERVWWFLVFCTTLALCGYLISQVYLKWERSPVIVSFATKETPIYSIPFPAVTICPEAKSVQSVYNHTEVRRKKLTLTDTNTTQEEDKIWEYMNLICENGVHLREFPMELSEHFYDTIFNLANLTENLFLFRCEYMGTEVSCKEIFKPIITDEGVCLTFNMLDFNKIFNENIKFYEKSLKDTPTERSSWTVENGYSEEDSLETFPRRALFSGATSSLSVEMATWKNSLDYVCKGGLQGYRVILHTPMRIPRASQQYFRVPLNQEILGSIQPIMMETSDTIKTFKPEKRECYFPSDKKLTYFKIYTQNNCKMECLTKYTLKKCGCVNFYMPRDNQTKVCGAGNKRCMKSAEIFLQTLSLQKQLKDDFKKDNSTFFSSTLISSVVSAFKSLTKQTPNSTSANPPSPPEDDTLCDCRPTCTDLSYNVETSQSDWDWYKLYSGLEGPENFQLPEDEVHLSRVTLFFKYSQFVTSRRSELYGPTDFLANFGGLLGLFTGFSALSLMEILYFLTIRIFCNIRLYGFWSGPDN